MASASESEPEKITRLEELSKDMLKMLKDGSSNDVKIILDDGELLANKDVLAARCEYFAATFRWNNENNNASGVIRIEGCSKKVMERIVEFLFTGVLKFEDLDNHSLMSLIDQIRKLVLGVDLENSVEEFFIDEILLKFEQPSELPILDFLLLTVKEQDLISSLHYAYNLNLKSIQCKLATMISFLYCSEIKLEEVKQMIVDLPMTLFKATLQACHCFKCEDVMKRLLDCHLIKPGPKQIDSRNCHLVAAWYEKNKDGCSKADKDDIKQFIKLDELLLSDLIKIVKPLGLFPDEEVDEMILAKAEKFDKNLLDEEKALFFPLDEEK